jgi:hypothetical protein
VGDQGAAGAGNRQGGDRDGQGERCGAGSSPSCDLTRNRFWADS